MQILEKYSTSIKRLYDCFMYISPVSVELVLFAKYCLKNKTEDVSRLYKKRFEILTKIIHNLLLACKYTETLCDFIIICIYMYLVSYFP